MIFSNSFKKSWPLSWIPFFIISLGSWQENSVPAQEKTSIEMCYSGSDVAGVVTWYAQEKKLYEKYDLTVNLTQIPSGSKAATALIAGNVEFCQIAGSAVVNATVAGGNLVMIAGFQNSYPYSLIVHDSIQSPEDLKGKAVAISSRGGSADAATRVALRHLGLEPDQEVSILVVGGQGARLAAMETKQVFGTLLSLPSTVEAEELGYQELLDMSNLQTPYQHTGMATTHSFLSENPDIVAQVLKASLEAIAQIKQDPQGTQEVLAKYLLLDPQKDASSLKRSYEKLVGSYLSDVPYPTLAGIQTLLDEVKASNPAASNYDPEDIADLTPIQILETEGFIKGLKK